MDLSKLQEKFIDRNPQPEGHYECYALLAPLVKIHDHFEFLFEVRSENLKIQPKEICLPGGRIEKNETPQEGAIREACEELRLSPHQIKILGPLDYLITPFNFILYPFLGFLEEIEIESILFNPEEVSSIFTVPVEFFIKNDPLEYFADVQAIIPQNFPYHMIQNGKNYPWRKGKYPILFYLYQKHVIWGMTARIIYNFIHLFKRFDF